MGFRNGSFWVSISFPFGFPERFLSGFHKDSAPVPMRVPLSFHRGSFVGFHNGFAERFGMDSHNGSLRLPFAGVVRWNRFATPFRRLPFAGVVRWGFSAAAFRQLPFAGVTYMTRMCFGPDGKRQSSWRAAARNARQNLSCRMVVARVQKQR